MPIKIEVRGIEHTSRKWMIICVINTTQLHRSEHFWCILSRCCWNIKPVAMLYHPQQLHFLCVLKRDGCWDQSSTISDRGTTDQWGVTVEYRLMEIGGQRQRVCVCLCGMSLVREGVDLFHLTFTSPTGNVTECQTLPLDIMVPLTAQSYWSQKNFCPFSPFSCSPTQCPKTDCFCLPWDGRPLSACVLHLIPACFSSPLQVSGKTNSSFKGHHHDAPHDITTNNLLKRTEQYDQNQISISVLIWWQYCRVTIGVFVRYLHTPEFWWTVIMWIWWPSK